MENKKTKKMRLHEKVGRTLERALTLGHWSAWAKMCVIIRLRLTVQELYWLAFVALKAMPKDEAVSVMELVLADGVGPPIPPLFDYMDEAAFWADMAEPDELKAYLLACFNRMPYSDQTAFLDFVHEGAAA